MAEAEYGSQRNRLVELSDNAEEFSRDFTYTAQKHGWKQAEAYNSLIVVNAQGAANRPGMGRPVRGFTEVRAVMVHWPGAQYAHYIVYRETDEGIYISRILHSSMDIPTRLKDQ